MIRKWSMIFLLLLTGEIFAQQPQHPFYDVDKEIRIEGKIEAVSMVPRYEKGAPFLVLSVKDKESETIYDVEISPSWFFGRNFHKGEGVKVLGSLFIPQEGPPILIARQVNWKGEVLVLRDEHGFPQWRGGGKGKSRRRSKRF